MKTRTIGLLFLPVAVCLLILSSGLALAQKPIVIGAPLSTAFLYGWDAERGIKLAVEEINAAGGVQVGKEKRPFKVEVIDTRDLEPGVPVSEALMAVEKLILEKKADFLIGGPVRSEAALAAMDLLSKYKKVSILTTGVLTPKYHARVAEEYDRLKYCFRIHGEAGQLVKEIMACFKELQDKHKLNKVFIMVQDVAHARGGGEIIAKIAAKQGWEVTGTEIYPTGTGDFSMGLLKAKKTEAQVLNIWMDMPESSILLKQWYELQIPALPFGSTLAAAEQPGFWKATEGKGEYTLCNVVNAGNAPSKATEWTMKFFDAYTKKWNIEPEGLGSSSSYMAVYTLKDAIERAQSVDSAKVVDALEKTDLMGVYGRIRFDPKTHQVIPALDPKEGAVGTILQWQKQKRVVVFPESIATGEIQLPPWMMKK
ncbi:MAG: ABC transporter substrate-binding protein [Deltaproteobacteria bacterium HGW-Deltaproteobacteria-15]|jgi:branched-chain amino acid transport system substrate-binding protein|nr:MAG: ABC transporter substrate-binding protein [Deltaproteobacteria bacterium HGW-Deltaproteobacteria-15]